jgi:hypothetical protein
MHNVNPSTGALAEDLEEPWPAHESLSTKSSQLHC